MVLESVLVSSFASAWLVFPAQLVKEIVFSPLYILASLVKDKVSIGAWIYLWAFYFVPLIYISVFVPVPYCLDDCTFVQFSSFTQSCPTLCDPLNHSTPGLPVHHQLLEFTQIHVHWVSDTIPPSHPLWSPSPPAFNLSQHQGLFQWVSSSHQVAKVLAFQLHHQFFQWIFRTDLL